MRFNGIKMKNISKVIVFSAHEHLSVATAIKTNLDRHNIDVRIWDEMIFQLSKVSLDSLTDELSCFDFAIAVVDSAAIIEDKGQTYKGPRDNVIFEVGLAMGMLGSDRTFLIHDNAVTPKLPTDLRGFTTARYTVKSDDSAALISALRPKCDEITVEIARHGPKTPPFNISLFANRSELQKASRFDEALAKSTTFDLVTFSGQFLRDYKPEIEKSLDRGSKIRILAYDDQPQTSVLYDALVNSLQLGSGEDKRKEAKELREYISSLHQQNRDFGEGIQLRFIRNDLLLYNMWKSHQEDGSQVAHLTMYFHGRDAPSIRVTGKDAALFETVTREFEQLWKSSVEIID